MPDLFFEDFTAGMAFPGATLTVTAEDAAFFARRFGPGVALEGAALEGAGPLAGWHVAALGMRLLFDAVLSRTAGLGGPGIEALSWPHPVWPGDALRFTASVVSTRVSASRPAMGLVTVAIALFNQGGLCVMTQGNAIMVARRDGADRPSTETRA